MLALAIFVNWFRVNKGVTCSLSIPKMFDERLSVNAILECEYIANMMIHDYKRWLQNNMYSKITLIKLLPHISVSNDMYRQHLFNGYFFCWRNKMYFIIWLLSCPPPFPGANAFMQHKTIKLRSCFDVIVYSPSVLFSHWCVARYSGTVNKCYPRFLEMMTSSNGNIFRVTGRLCGEFTAQSPVTRSFLWSAPE